jgi:hypothetical protein
MLALGIENEIFGEEYSGILSEIDELEKENHSEVVTPGRAATKKRKREEVDASEAEALELMRSAREALIGMSNNKSQKVSSFDTFAESVKQDLIALLEGSSSPFNLKIKIMTILAGLNEEYGT